MITMNIFNYEKSSKTVFSLIDSESKQITDEQYKNILSAKDFFKRLGGSEREQKNYTSRGFLTTKLTSISPCKEKKTVREFYFDE